jgi:pimeloyl-ACP methyl ester carboxylesterase
MPARPEEPQGPSSNHPRNEQTADDQANLQRWQQTKPNDRLPFPPMPDAQRARIRKDVVAEKLAHGLAYKDISKLTAEDHAYLAEQGLKVGQELHGRNGLELMTFVPIEGSNTQPVLAFRGSSALKDFVSDANPRGVGADQFAMSEGDIARVLASLQQYGKPLVTGHSLGGALAQMAAVRFPDMVGRVVTFQSPGIPKDMVGKLDAHNAKAKAEGRPEVESDHYQVAGDLVPLAGEAFTTGFLTHIERAFEPMHDSPVQMPFEKGSFAREHIIYPVDEFVQSGEGLGAPIDPKEHFAERGPSSAHRMHTSEIDQFRRFPKMSRAVERWVESVRVAAGRAIEVLERVGNLGRAPKRAYEELWNRVRAGHDAHRSPEELAAIVEGSRIRESDKQLMIDQLRKLVEATKQPAPAKAEAPANGVRPDVEPGQRAQTVEPSKNADVSKWATPEDRKGVPSDVPLTRDELRNVLRSKYETIGSYEGKQKIHHDPQNDPFADLIKRLEAEPPGSIA